MRAIFLGNCTTRLFNDFFDGWVSVVWAEKETAAFMIGYLLLLFGIAWLALLIPVEYGMQIMLLDGLAVSLSLFAAVLLVRVQWRFEPGEPVRAIWRWLAGGFFLQGVGMAVVFWLEHAGRGAVPVPSLADFFLAISDLLLFWGLWRFITYIVQQPFVPAYSGEAIAVVAGFTVMLLTAVLVIVPQLGMYGDPLIERALITLYASMDVLGFLLALRLLLMWVYVGYTPIMKPWVIFAVAFLVFTLTDTLLDWYKVWGMDPSGAFIDHLWALGFWVVGYACLQQLRLLDNPSLADPNAEVYASRLL